MGEVHRTGYFHVLTLTVEDVESFPAEIAEAIEGKPGLFNILSHIIPAQRTFYATLAVKEGVVTEQKLGALTERIDLLRKVTTNYTAPMRYGPVSAAFVSGTTPKAKARAHHG